MGGRETQQADATVAIAGWAGVGCAILAAVGIVLVPSLLVLWVVLIVVAVAAVPQALLVVRREQRERARK